MKEGNNSNSKDDKFPPVNITSSTELSPTLTPIITNEIITKRSITINEIEDDDKDDDVMNNNNQHSKRRKQQITPIISPEPPQIKSKTEKTLPKKVKEIPLKVIITPIMGKEFHFILENPTIFDVKDAIYKKLELDHDLQILTPSINSSTKIDDSTPLLSLVPIGSATINLRLSIKVNTGLNFNNSIADYDFISSELASPFSTDIEGFGGSGGGSENLEQILLNSPQEGDRRLAVVDVVSEGGKGKKSLLVEFDGDSLANAKIIGELSSNGLIKKTIPTLLTEVNSSNDNTGDDSDVDDISSVILPDSNNEDISTYLDRAINIKEEEESEKKIINIIDDGPVRCTKCNRKCRLGGQFKCRCDLVFCGTHRYPDMHNCTFDHKAFGRKLLGKANPKLEDSHRL